MVKLKTLFSQNDIAQPKTLRTLTVDESRQISGGAGDALLIINRLGATDAKQARMSNFEIQHKMQTMNRN